MALTITYEVINGEFDITVTLATTSDPLTIIATRVITAVDGYGRYSFVDVPEDNYILTFTDSLNCIDNALVCDLNVGIDELVYICEFDFTVDFTEIPPSPSPTSTPTPTLTPSISISSTPGATRSLTPTLTRSITPTITPSKTPTISPSKTPTPTPSKTPTISPSKTPTSSIIPSSTPTPTPTTSPGAPKLEITGVINSACGQIFGVYFIQIFITGGTAPYQYSIDNGTTLTAPIYNTSYLFSGLTPGGTYNIYVVDSAGEVYRWTEIDCGVLCVAFIPIYLTPTVTGYYRYYYDGPSYPTRYFDLTQGMQDCNIYGTIVEAVGVADGENFLGWSYELADRFTINNISWITGDETLIYTFKTHGVKIYGYFMDNGPISKDFCFNAADDPRYMTDSDKEQVCTVCADEGGTIVTVYFNTTLYQANGIENVTWYSDAALTTVVTNGYYVDGSQSFSTIYGVGAITSGLPINHGTCEGGDLLCP